MANLGWRAPARASAVSGGAGSYGALIPPVTARPTAQVLRAVGRSHAVLLLQLFALTLMIFPSDEVIKAVGGAGYAAALVSYCVFLAWVAATLFGLHNPLDYRYPARIALCTLWVASLGAYVFMNYGGLSVTQQNGADRWIMQLAGVSGIVLVTAECLRNIEDINRVLRALMWGGAFAGVVAAMQYWAHYDITPYLRTIPGFSINEAVGYVGIGSRGALNRVSGTAVDPIELGVVAGMLLPLAVYLALHDLKRPAWRRWLPVVCIALAVPTSVSRSAILATLVALGVLIASFPPARRISAFIGILVAVCGVFVTAHGLIGTMRQFFLAGTSDPSLAHRVNNYPYVESLVRQRPLFGQGGGTYSVSMVHILDNQYLTTVVELGLAGLFALAFFLIWPALSALAARARAMDPAMRDLCAALAGAELAATLCSGTFDSLSFPMFVNVQALIVGLTGAVWVIINRQRRAAPARPAAYPHNGRTRTRPAGPSAMQRGGGI